MTSYLLVAFLLGLSAATLLCWLASRRRDLERRDLHVCPFCGCPVLNPPINDLDGWRVVCDNCGARGPRMPHPRDALRVWYRWP